MTALTVIAESGEVVENAYSIQCPRLAVSITKSHVVSSLSHEHHRDEVEGLILGSERVRAANRQAAGPT